MHLVVIDSLLQPSHLRSNTQSSTPQHLHVSTYIHPSSNTLPCISFPYILHIHHTFYSSSVKIWIYIEPIRYPSSLFSLSSQFESFEATMANADTTMDKIVVVTPVVILICVVIRNVALLICSSYQLLLLVVSWEKMCLVMPRLVTTPWFFSYIDFDSLSSVLEVAEFDLVNCV